MLTSKQSWIKWWSKQTGARKEPALTGRRDGDQELGQPPQLTPRKMLPLLAMGMGLVLNSILSYRSAAAAPLTLEDMPVLPVETVRRALVIAPHPDDETLAAGGLIQTLLAQGTQVKVVFMTNGDGQAVAPLILRRELRPRAANYVVTGKQRQAEALAALELLGVLPEDVLFLGYPDRGLHSLWTGSWTGDYPLRATYTRTTRSPYALTYNVQAVYCREDVLADLRTILAGYQPDLVLMPHPCDQHRDHSAGSNFVRLALASETAACSGYRPETWAYLVHYKTYPQRRGLCPDGALLPPVPLLAANPGWVRFELTSEQIALKAKALAVHTTQQRLLGSFLRSFIRRNELFVPIPIVHSLAEDNDLRQLEIGAVEDSRLPALVFNTARS